MKSTFRVFLAVAAIFSALLNACAPATAPVVKDAPVTGGKPHASLVEFTGVIEAINGDQWTISGQTVIVDPSVLRDGPFNVGDTVKVEGQVASDGSIIITRIESPSAFDEDDNSNDSNINDDNSNDDNDNDADNDNDNDNDDDSSDDNDNGSSGKNDNSNDDDHADDNSNDD